jgi:hypothetical protein
MKKRYAERQIVYALKQSDLIEKIPDFYREMRVAEASLSGVARFISGKGNSAIWDEDDEVGTLNVVKGAAARNTLLPSYIT